MSDDERAYACTGKQRMTDEEARRARKRPGFRGVYRCRYCRAWHPASHARAVNDRRRR